MNGKTVKNKKSAKTQANPHQRAAQILFAIFAIILILSMVLSTVTNF
jgi:hypothetical protein